MSLVALEVHIEEEIQQLKDALDTARLENESLAKELSKTKQALVKYSALELEWRKLSLAIESAKEAFIVTDKNATIEYVNPAFTEITGYTRQEVIGQKTSMLKSDVHVPMFYENLWQTISQGKVWQGNLIEKRKDGTYYPCLMSIVPVENQQQDISHFVAIQNDMTKERELEEQFIQAQKMEAMGTLVAGVSHDFNNILTAMQGNVFLAKRKLTNPEYVKESLESIELLSLIAVDMVKQLLSFARKDKIVMKSFSLNTFMKEAFKLAGSAIPKNIQQECNTCQEKLVIKGDATQLQQILMNLVNNACFAVAEVAEPKVSCKLEYYQANQDFLLKHPGLETEYFAHLSVSDNGHGITKEHLKKIFEPFYTTKGVGEGTGLGLSMVFDSIERHGGLIEVETALGKGTTFHLYLPLDEQESNAVTIDEMEILPGQGETILFVDNDVSGEVTISVLEDMGYNLLSAKSAVEAVQLLNKRAAEIDLIIVDVLLSTKSSLDSVRKMRLSHADIPIILVSGYDQGEPNNPAQGIKKSVFITKPFSYGPLSKHIRAMVE